MAQEKRVVVDCRQVPGSNCSLTIAGKESEVIEAASAHAAKQHGVSDTPQLRQQIRQSWKEEALTR